MRGLHERISPWRVMTELDEVFRIAEGPFVLSGPRSSALSSGLDFHWSPDARFIVDGETSGCILEIAESNWRLQGKIRDSGFQAPIFLTDFQQGLAKDVVRVRGFISGPVEMGAREAFETLRFSIVNFPSYLGTPIQDAARSLTYLGRLSLPYGEGNIRVDAIPEVENLRKRAAREGGFVISHVGEYQPAAGLLTSETAAALLEALSRWLGFCRGAWTGPVFPQGLRAGEIAWEQIAPWRLSEGREVASWLPRGSRVDLAAAFAGFIQCWQSKSWRDPLASAIAWYVEANSKRTTNETRLILAQVALEMMAYVVAVETHQLHSRADFDRLSAGGRIRSLLQALGIPLNLPAHLIESQKLLSDDVFDGPGLISYVRNKLVHATATGRAAMSGVSGIQRWECGQLALQYLELVLLALFGYRGNYVQRTWRGSEGGSEVLVPWRQADTKLLS